jgi:hypothetical protein
LKTPIEKKIAKNCKLSAIVLKISVLCASIQMYVHPKIIKTPLEIALAIRPSPIVRIKMYAFHF